MPIEIDSAAESSVAYGPVLALAREQRLSVYDASYPELAMRLGLPLATLGSRLREAARILDVPLVEV